MTGDGRSVDEVSGVKYTKASGSASLQLETKLRNWRNVMTSV